MHTFIHVMDHLEDLDMFPPFLTLPKNFPVLQAPNTGTCHEASKNRAKLSFSMALKLFKEHTQEEKLPKECHKKQKTF